MLLYNRHSRHRFRVRRRCLTWGYSSSRVPLLYGLVREYWFCWCVSWPDRRRIPRGGVLPCVWAPDQDWAVLKGLAMGLQRPQIAGGDRGVSRPPTDATSAKRYPTLLQYLSEETWADGVKRERSTVLLVYEDGLFKACVIDKDLDATLWGSAETLVDCLGCLEARLNDDKAEWRRRKPQTGRRPK